MDALENMEEAIEAMHNVMSYLAEAGEDGLNEEAQRLMDKLTERRDEIDQSS